MQSHQGILRGLKLYRQNKRRQTQSRNQIGHRQHRNHRDRAHPSRRGESHGKNKRNAHRQKIPLQARAMSLTRAVGDNAKTTKNRNHGDHHATAHRFSHPDKAQNSRENRHRGNDKDNIGHARVAHRQREENSRAAHRNKIDISIGPATQRSPNRARTRGHQHIDQHQKPRAQPPPERYLQRRDIDQPDEQAVRHNKQNAHHRDEQPFKLIAHSLAKWCKSLRNTVTSPEENVAASSAS